jgi:hypothetical protein
MYHVKLNVEGNQGLSENHEQMIRQMKSNVEENNTISECILKTNERMEQIQKDMHEVYVTRTNQQVLMKLTEIQ